MIADNRVLKRLSLGVLLPLGVFASVVSFTNGGLEAVARFWLMLLVCIVISVVVTAYMWWLMK